MSRYSLKLIITTGVLLILGLFMVYSASSPVSLVKFDTNTYFLKKQVLYSLIGIFVMFTASRIDYNVYRNISYPLLFLGGFLILLTYLPHIGKVVNGAHRWINAGPINLQPSEIVKIFLVINMAYLLDKKQEKLSNFSFGFLPFVIIPGIILLLILGQKDFGTCILMAIVMFFMMLIGGVRFTYLIATTAFLSPIVYFLIAKSKYRLMRIIVFMHPWKHYHTGGYQLAQSLLSFKAGGLLGRGIGCSQQKQHFLPESFTDYIFSIFAEELGFLGVLVVVGLFTYLFLISIRMSLSVKNRFGKLLGIGLTILIVLEAFFNFAVCLSLVPPKGIALPFFSYGGSSLISTMFAIGILLNISKDAENE